MKTSLLEKHCRKTIVGRLKVKWFHYAQNRVGHENYNFLFADCKQNESKHFMIVGFQRRVHHLKT